MKESMSEQKQFLLNARPVLDKSRFVFAELSLSGGNLFVSINLSGKHTHAIRITVNYTQTNTHMHAFPPNANNIDLNLYFILQQHGKA